LFFIALNAISVYNFFVFSKEKQNYHKGRVVAETLAKRKKELICGFGSQLSPSFVGVAPICSLKSVAQIIPTNTVI